VPFYLVVTAVFLFLSFYINVGYWTEKKATFVHMRDGYVQQRYHLMSEEQSVVNRAGVLCCTFL